MKVQIYCRFIQISRCSNLVCRHISRSEKRTVNSIYFLLYSNNRTRTWENRLSNHPANFKLQIGLLFKLLANFVESHRVAWKIGNSIIFLVYSYSKIRTVVASSELKLLFLLRASLGFPSTTQTPVLWLYWSNS